MSKVAIIGPGAVGGTVAAWLASTTRHEIVLCARTKLDRLEIETPDGELLSSTPQVLTKPTEASPVDWILVATKAYDAQAAAEWLPGLTGPHTRLAVLQNGVEHVERFAPYFDSARIVPVVVDCPAERSAPGRIRQRRFGKMTLPDSAAGRAYRDMFAGTRIELVVTTDFTTAAWTKLCFNSAGAVDALALKPTRVIQIPEAAELIRGIVTECVAVGRAEGAVLPDTLVDAVIEGYFKGPQDSVNSMLADRRAQRRMEIEARNGVIVRRGAKHGIPTPLNQAAVAILKAIEAP